CRSTFSASEDTCCLEAASVGFSLATTQLFKSRLAMEASAIKDNDGVRRPAMIYPVEAIKMPETPLQETNEMDVSLAGSHEDNLASSTRLPTLADRNKRHHRGKDRLGVRKVSRKRGHQKQRKPSRCSHA
ncbi:hypothetical protein PF007_g30407, partial [Phytophthora fragariae]